MLSATMRLLRRILTTVAITLGVIALGAFWVAPLALSFDAARTAAPVTRLVPTELKDTSVSQVPGTKLSYFGYEFEIPRTDLDETRTRLLPKNHPYMALLAFHSGLILMVSASPANEFPQALAREWKASPQIIESAFGPGASQSDCRFLKNLYEFTPEKMHRWALFPSTHYREQMLLTLKATILSDSGDSGIFNVRDQDWCGFQLGDPQAHPRKVAVQFYSGEKSVEFTFASKNSDMVTQPEINRMVQSFRKAPEGDLH